LDDDSPVDVRDQNEITAESSNSIENNLVPFGTWYDTVVGPFITE
jgi:hypothetical protein